MEDTLVVGKSTVVTDSFDGSDTPPEIKPVVEVIEKKDDVIIDKNQDQPIIEKKDDVVIDDGVNFLKEKLGFDKWEDAKSEFETLKTKAKAPVELKYESLDTTKIKELYATIDKKEKLGKLIEGDITKDLAPAIIKAAMLEKYKGLSQDMINHRFNKLYSIPAAPKEDDFTDGDEYDIAKNAWKEKVADIEMEMVIEANLSRPELQKLHSEIKLPELPQSQSESKEYTAEELAAFQTEVDAFVQKADDVLNKFEGFNVSYKDKDVDIQTNYSLSAEEKKAVLGNMKLLAEQNYNANAVFAQRWVNDDSTFNFAQIAKDLAILETHDKSAQKFVSDAATKATLKFIKDKHNVDLKNQSPGGDLQLEDRSTQKQNEDAIWN